MSNAKERCSICRQWYKPDPRTRWHQQCCSKAACRKEQKRRTDQGWRARHPSYGESRRLKVQSWAVQYPHYWQEYRRENPEYRARDNQRRRESRERARNAAKQVVIQEITVDRLASIPRWEAESAAKQVMMDRRVDELIEYLQWRDGAAKQVVMAMQRTNGP